MVFADLIFIYLFLPLNLIMYFQSGNRKYRNLVLIFFSLYFYAWGEPIWITLLIFSATIDYFHGLMIERYRGEIGGKIAVASSLILNLGLLGIFKYSHFFVTNLNAMFNLDFSVPQFALPIGISFYTFQTISYTVDVYRGKADVQHSYLDFLMYVSLYFQLVAGPIIRYRDIEHEIFKREENVQDISAGLTRFCVGLAKKVLIANTAGRIALPYLLGDSGTVLGAWFGIILFTLQMYYDFSGYSDMAIGLGRMFGFHFLENFNYPYISKTVTEFWRRWHMSLGNFFKVYLYIPLGGSRSNYVRNLFIVWLATGFWHGASWNFIFWGLYYGVLIFIEHQIGMKKINSMPSFVMHGYLLLVTLFGWLLFYFVDLADGWKHMKTMLGLASAPLYDMPVLIDISNNIFWLILACIFCAPLSVKIKVKYETAIAKYPVLEAIATPLFNIIILLLCSAMLVGQSYNPFLYYRF